MTMTLTTSLPAVAAITFSSAKAALRKSSSLASGLAKIRLRSLPLTCTATSISSSRASSSLNPGQRAARGSPCGRSFPQLFRDVRRERREHRYQRLKRFARNLNIRLADAAVLLNRLIERINLVSQFHQRRNAGVQMQSLFEVLRDRANDLMRAATQASLIIAQLARLDRCRGLTGNTGCHLYAIRHTRCK